MPVAPPYDEGSLDPHTRTCYNQEGRRNAKGPPMRIGYTPEQEELRRELRSYFAKLITRNAARR
ncbi:hypothetical protein I552_2789 [Mycobacterium xenopi 3993]|nr:hypothetical protein I552_2789 [Mycobacterium xenopi 3993]